MAMCKKGLSISGDRMGCVPVQKISLHKEGQAISFRDIEKTLRKGEGQFAVWVHCRLDAGIYKAVSGAITELTNQVWSLVYGRRALVLGRGFVLRLDVYEAVGSPDSIAFKIIPETEWGVGQQS